MMSLEELRPFVGGLHVPYHLEEQAAFAEAAEHHLIRSADAETSRPIVWRGGVYLIAAFNEGRLLAHYAVRRCLHVTGDALTLDFRALWSTYESLPENAEPLSNRAAGIIELACALSHGTFIKQLNTLLEGLDGWNSWAVHVAIGISLRQLPLQTPSGLRAFREAALRGEHGGNTAVLWSTALLGTATDGGA